MKQNKKEYLPAILNVATGAGVFIISLLSLWLEQLRFPMSTKIAKPFGLFIVYAGMSLVVWAALNIKGAFLGEVETRLDILVQSGPYRFVRHPIYLGMTIALAGIPVLLRNWLGRCVYFVPSQQNISGKVRREGLECEVWERVGGLCSTYRFNINRSLKENQIQEGRPPNIRWSRPRYHGAENKCVVAVAVYVGNKGQFCSSHAAVYAQAVIRNRL